MNPFFTFIGGLVAGIYIAQRYNVPDVGKLAKKGVDKIKELEKDGE